MPIVAMKDDPRRRDPAAYPWRVTLDTRFADMDVNRHLNNVAITRFFEETRIRFNVEQIAGNPDTLEPIARLMTHLSKTGPPAVGADGPKPHPILYAKNSLFAHEPNQQSAVGACGPGRRRRCAIGYH
jgi:hypothetical protein